MKPGDLVEWNYGAWRLKGILIKKSGHFGWEVYFPSDNSVKHMEASALRKLQELR